MRVTIIRTGARDVSVMLIIIKTAFIRIESVTLAIRKIISVNTVNLSARTAARRLVKKVVIRVIRRMLF